MKYLSYTLDGFTKKCLLDKPVFKIGRDETNDLRIDDTFVSRRHVDIHVGENAVVVQDAGSANGFYVNDAKKKKAVLQIGQSFKIGEVVFTLGTGDTKEFSLSDKFQPDFAENKTGEPPSPPSQHRYTDTRSRETIYKEIEDEVFSKGLRFENFDVFVGHLSARLTEIPGFGALFLAEQTGPSLTIRFSVNSGAETITKLKKLAADTPRIFQERFPLSGAGRTAGAVPAFGSEPLVLRGKPHALVYFTSPSQSEDGARVGRFLFSLAKGLDLLDKVLEEKKQLMREKNRDETGDSEIITNSRVMKDLIKQAQKIADSDIFILVEGESGAGKELFARLIHRCSPRKDQRFVALNCAAIPENLLESELFGYEKGAFTGAFKQKQGKLELASGGTLVLDEIGDMPLNLQSKLLRAIQEHEFYRLGGSTPIKVDLRIISLTHQNLEDLIKGKRFREDLYYRLVHRILVIPPLRERREDIPPLINFFTNAFCRRKNRSVAGYSVKAFEALVSFDWRGNVRQLENEINSIVNLTDEGETVDFDILSDKIKRHSESGDATGREAPGNEPHGFNRKPGRDEIVAILERSGWNKSKAAKELNMTYHGLHKKMKKMGITREGT